MNKNRIVNLFLLISLIFSLLLLNSCGYDSDEQGGSFLKNILRQELESQDAEDKEIEKIENPSDTDKEEPKLEDGEDTVPLTYKENPGFKKPKTNVSKAKETAGYKKAYADVLRDVLQYGDIPSYDDTGFSLVYIDSDDIPELVYYLNSCHAAGAEVYTFKNGEAIPLDTYDEASAEWNNIYGEFGGIYYLERGGFFTSQYWGMGCEYISVYRLENGKATHLIRFDANVDYEEYSIDGKSVTYDEYISVRKQYGITHDVYELGNYAHSRDKNHYLLNENNINKVLGQ